MSRHFCTAHHRLYRESSRAVFDFECSWTRSYVKPYINTPELPGTVAGRAGEINGQTFISRLSRFLFVHPTQAI